MRQRLETAVAAAVGAMLVGREEITLEEVQRALPAHIAQAGPSLKSMTKALVGAGWVGQRREGGCVVYVLEDAIEVAHPADHNGCADGSIASEAVRLFVERVERLEEDRKALSDDIRDVWSEAKSQGYDTGALREIVKLRKKAPADRNERQAILEVYLRTMGMM